jgi:FkbM family methyltransferase
MIGLERFGPFDSVLDVGGNLGDFAELARMLWPHARITSFEPIPQVAERQRERARGRWTVETVAISDREGTETLFVCLNQHTASTLQPPGPTRRIRFGIRDTFAPVEVLTVPLDHYLDTCVVGRLLVKIDVEGHEGAVLAGASETLPLADAVIVEVQQDPEIFVGSPAPEEVDRELQCHGLRFAGILDAFKSPAGDVVQFDGIWAR